MISKKVTDCAKALASNGYTIFFAESATAGRMCSEFALSPFSGAILRGGISCYEIFIKEQFLKVPHNLIKEFTPESMEVTEALAKNCSKLFNAKITVAVTGLTTPGGSETEDKPVGTMFICVIMPGATIRHREVFSGSPEEIILKTIDRAAMLVLEKIN